ncbi:MAG: hypothetical protein ACPGUE_20645 [Marinomonas sp.]|jgi:oligopeptide transport system ATP-binding protein
MSHAPILEVKSLSISFALTQGTLDAVKNLSFELYKGETPGNLRISPPASACG